MIPKYEIWKKNHLKLGNLTADYCIPRVALSVTQLCCLIFGILLSHSYWEIRGNGNLQKKIDMDFYIPTLLFFSLSKSYFVSQFTVETYCFADGRCLFKQPQSVIYHWNQYDEKISKKCRSVCPFVTLTKKAYSFFIIDSRKTIRISGERAYNPLQENTEIFSKKIFFKNFRANFRWFLHLQVA